MQTTMDCGKTNHKKWGGEVYFGGERKRRRGGKGGKDEGKQ